MRSPSIADLQHPQKYCRLSARKETFSAQRRQSARNRTFRRGWVKVVFVPQVDIPRLSEGMPECAPSPGNIRPHYNCQSRHAEPILCANAPASATVPYCWKQANLAERPHLPTNLADHNVDVLAVPPSAPRNLPVEFVHPAHVRKYWAVLPSAFVAAQNNCTPRRCPVGSMLIG